MLVARPLVEGLADARDVEAGVADGVDQPLSVVALGSDHANFHGSQFRPVFPA